MAGARDGEAPGPGEVDMYPGQGDGDRAWGGSGWDPEYDGGADRTQRMGEVPGQGGYPRQGGPDQQHGGYQGGYPQQGGYGQQQGGYERQYGGYPPQQGGYGPPPGGDDWAGYDQGSGGGGGNGGVIAVVAVVVALLLVGGVAAFLFLRPGGEGGAPAAGGEEVVTITSTAPVETDAPATSTRPTSPTTTSRAPRPASVLEECSDSGGDLYPRSGRGTDNTTCPFARSVRDAYLGAGHIGGAATIEADSPVTGQTYTMRCNGTDEFVVCRGGNNAVVYLY